MCGITGVMYFEDREPSVSMLQQMTDVIHHRGPNDSGFWTENRIGLGFRRLSIIDIAEGHQPLCNEDESVWIIFNGEIYNYKSLRSMLQDRGHVFRTNSDTEVIVHLYEEFGEECVKHLRGMFGFAIWDRRKKQLFAARDHFGIKPFYYQYNDRQLLFGSEIKSLVASGSVSPSIRTESLMNYLTFQYVPEPNTMFEGIQKLPPAHYIKASFDGEMSIHRYWDPMFEPVDRPFGEYVEQIRETLKDSVVHHMVSDVERGCFLSSGIDSTAIAAHMRQIEPIRTFSVGFEGPNNETLIAAETAKALGTEHYSKIITREDFFNTLPKAVWHQDEPVADPSAIALYHVAQLAREHVTVTLSGEGADELFGGYRIYREPLSLAPLESLPLSVRRMLHRLVKMLPAGMKGRNYLLRGTTPLEERFLGNAKIFTEDMKAEVLRVDSEMFKRYQNPFQIAAQYYDKTKHQDPVTRMQYIDMNLWMPGDILMKADKMTMAHSLELRVPLLDKELFEVARRIPTKYRIAEGTTKHIFRKAMEGIVPDFILNRPKLGFPVPLRDWLKGPTGSTMVEQIKASGIEDYVKIDAIERMAKLHQNGQGDYARRLWTIYMFALWHATYMQETTKKAVAAF
ncbi:asparagine synthase (glutamine-hydrolyzing) [Paenibacillus chitinolyticus]|uniref:asparagine synthase (glutamine-hydrolyzing) n=1 Tax=Paenibacillus chitinolyticus TaxID=79263 RepID=A0A410X2N0_9BACL|nr:asparagine synthase (glutamine-hydrolyzing) [Paenibacillus chitinolyticus]MCY9591376.1 asparagine synthase (glutamine-hydrolyzing) [Paenibacillus chitinolyticus]MCY9599365.1 asparagine synthase (glutamine-hydrolyzing) [Paenibacillus chitinolyticus]QAV20878.1 asparagine synthase (glutamine-hydrolyzing) [Paenibacillus chitinolyticus]